MYYVVSIKFFLSDVEVPEDALGGLVGVAVNSELTMSRVGEGSYWN